MKLFEPDCVWQMSDREYKYLLPLCTCQNLDQYITYTVMAPDTGTAQNYPALLSAPVISH